MYFIFEQMSVFNESIFFSLKKNLLAAKNLDSFTLNYFVGDLISVRFIRLENDREVEMNFVGLCLAKYSKGLSSTFTLRNVISGVPVEQNFVLYSPLIKSLVVLKSNSDLLRSDKSKLFAVRHLNLSKTKFAFIFSMKPFTTSTNDFKSLVSSFASVKSDLSSDYLY